MNWYNEWRWRLGVLIRDEWMEVGYKVFLKQSRVYAESENFF